MAEKVIKARVSDKKKKELAELVKLIDSNNTILITFTTNIPSSQLQKIRKQLKDAIMRVSKKKVFIRALENSKKEKSKELIDYLTESSAVIFSNSDPFEIASLLAQYKYPVRAKAGQIAHEDIVVEEGPTELMPGPAISDLGGVGLKTGIVAGKIAIKETKVLVKKNEEISKKVANVLGMLEMAPFKIGLEPVAAFDTKNNKVYKNIIIDQEGTLERFKEGKVNVLKLAYSIVYPIKEVIGLILSKAKSHADSLKGLVKEAKPVEVKEAKPEEPKAEDTPSEAESVEKKEAPVESQSPETNIQTQ